MSARECIAGLTPGQPIIRAAMVEYLDAYRDEVLREAAEKIRKDPLCTKPAHRDYYADLIDPDKGS